jgi:hypothetical protein
MGFLLLLLDLCGIVYQIFLRMSTEREKARKTPWNSRKTFRKSLDGWEKVCYTKTTYEKRLYFLCSFLPVREQESPSPHRVLMQK